MAEQPIPAQKEPYGINVEVGKRYFWCACGRSASQPFCDGTHNGL
jgi:CDGSH-type Zn-finger protein